MAIESTHRVFYTQSPHPYHGTAFPIQCMEDFKVDRVETSDKASTTHGLIETYLDGVENAGKFQTYRTFPTPRVGFFLYQVYSSFWLMCVLTATSSKHVRKTDARKDRRDCEARVGRRVEKRSLP